MREFQMEVMFNNFYKNEDGYKSKASGGHWARFLQLKRDYQCTCLCCNRPVVEVKYVYGGENKRLGYVRDEWTCGDYCLELYEEGNPMPLYRVNASCCQCGFHCHIPCGPCKQIIFDITNLQDHEARVGEVKKVWSGCAKELFSNADDYSVLFPKAIPWKHKALFLACVLFVDYRYFEENNDRNQHRRGHAHF